MPTGNSCAGRRVRAATSAQQRKMAPTTKLSGTNRRCGTPTTRRTAWGTIRPTKPMAPDTATSVPVTAAASTIRPRLMRSTGMPRLCAGSSPMSMASRGRARKTSRPKPSAVTSAGMGRRAQRVPLSDPSSQKRTARSLSGSGDENVMNDVTDDISADIATPASSSRATATRDPSRPIRYTIVIESSPPRNAATGIDSAFDRRGGRKPR